MDLENTRTALIDGNQIKSIILPNNGQMVSGHPGPGHCSCLNQKSLFGCWIVLKNAPRETNFLFKGRKEV